MKTTCSLLFFVVLFSACGPASKYSEAISTCRATQDAMAALFGGLEFPKNFQSENPVKTGGEFNVMQYFTVLDHLSMQPGFILDYVYHYDGMGGFPVLYVRPSGQPPYATEADLATVGETSSYLDYIQADDTPESYLQFVMLSMIGSQFYLYWHADYNDSQIVCDKVAVSNIVSSLNGDFGYRISLPSLIRAAMLKDVGPVVNIGAQVVEIRLMTFTRWGGFFQDTYTLTRSFPHAIQGIQEKNLVPYECGVMF
jgi:hypothetical protein